MSWKSLLCSIFAVLLAGGFIYLDIVLFGIALILGIIGIVLTVAIPVTLIRKAIAESYGVADKLIAKIVAPALIAAEIFFIVMSLFVWN